MVKMGVKPDFKPPIPFIHEKEKEKESAHCEKPVAVKLQHGANGVATPNPTTEKTWKTLAWFVFLVIIVQHKYFLCSIFNLAVVMVPGEWLDGHENQEYIASAFFSVIWFQVRNMPKEKKEFRLVTSFFAPWISPKAATKGTWVEANTVWSASVTWLSTAWYDSIIMFPRLRN
jgi:hypothetical protein